jgi:hypothetical protein
VRVARRKRERGVERRRTNERGKGLDGEIWMKVGGEGETDAEKESKQKSYTRTLDRQTTH